MGPGFLHRTRRRRRDPHPRKRVPLLLRINRRTRVPRRWGTSRVQPPRARYCSGHSDHTTGRGPWHSRTKSQSGNGSRNGLSRLPFDRENDTESGNARVLPLIRPSAGIDPRPSRPRKNDHNIAELSEAERNEDTATAAVQSLPKALSTSTFHPRERSSNTSSWTGTAPSTKPSAEQRSA